jgi:hypothetical protein
MKSSKNGSVDEKVGLVGFRALLFGGGRAVFPSAGKTESRPNFVGSA